MSDHDSGGAGGTKGVVGTAPTFGAFVPKPNARAPTASDAPGAASDVAPIRAESTESWPDDAVEVGAIVDAYGLKGWVKVVAHASAGQGGGALLSANRWWLLNDCERKSVAVLRAKLHSGSIVAHLGGFADRDAAFALRGYRIYIQRGDFPVLDADEYYWVDLLGLDVVNDAGMVLGQVASLSDNGAHSVLRVEYPTTAKDGRTVMGERLIPFVGVYVKTVDRAARRIVVDWQADY
jgi:16S rRNA processing protein RimM